MYSLKKLLFLITELMKWGLLAIALWLVYYAAQTFEVGSGRDNSAPDERTPVFEEYRGAPHR